MSHNVCNHVKKSTNILFCAFQNEMSSLNVRERYGIFHTVVRNFMTGCNPLRTKHYTSLGLTPKATQNEIKSAYYKLSMLYHPDRNQDAEAAQKFRDITEAYEVLGNINLKKLYDRGVLGNELHPQSSVRRPGVRRTAPVPEDPKMRFYQKRAFKDKIPSMEGDAPPIYDFDEWYRSHYGSVSRTTFYYTTPGKRKPITVNYKSLPNKDFSKPAKPPNYLISIIIVVTLIFICTLMQLSAPDSVIEMNLNDDNK